MANKNNTNIDSDMTYDEAVDVLKKSKKKRIISIVVDSFIDAVFLGATVYNLKNENYAAAGISGALLVGSSVVTAKDVKELKEISETLDLTNDQINDDKEDK